MCHVGLVHLGIGLAMLGKFAITCSFSIIYVYTAELFPTTVRSLGLGLCNMMARVGGMLAPFMADVVSSTSLQLLIRSSLKAV